MRFRTSAMVVMASLFAASTTVEAGRPGGSKPRRAAKVRAASVRARNIVTMAEGTSAWAGADQRPAAIERTLGETAGGWKKAARGLSRARLAARLSLSSKNRAAAAEAGRVQADLAARVEALRAVEAGPAPAAEPALAYSGPRATIPQQFLHPHKRVPRRRGRLTLGWEYTGGSVERNWKAIQTRMTGIEQVAERTGITIDIAGALQEVTDVAFSPARLNGGVTGSGSRVAMGAIGDGMIAKMAPGSSPHSLWSLSNEEGGRTYRVSVFPAEEELSEKKAREKGNAPTTEVPGFTILRRRTIPLTGGKVAILERTTTEKVLPDGRHHIKDVQVEKIELREYASENEKHAFAVKPQREPVTTVLRDEFVPQIGLGPAASKARRARRGGGRPP